MDAPANETFQIKALAPLKGADIQENRIRGKAAVTGNMDRGGDVIFPGAFKSAISGFLSAGFISDGHNWEEVADIVGYPISAKEVDGALECEAEFHSTENAQNVRQICMERIKAGKSVGLSIGFSLDYNDPDARMWFENGAAMAKYIVDSSGYDESQFDMAGIKKYKGYCRAIFKVKELYEYSIVTIPMNPMAVTTAVKTISFDAGSLNELRFEDHSESVLTAVKEFLGRATDYARLRKDKGRPLSAERAKEFEALRDELDALVRSATDAEAKAPDVASLQRRARVLSLGAPTP